MRINWAAEGRLNEVLRDRMIPINLKKRVLNNCILPVLTNVMEIMTLTEISGDKLRTTQRTMERVMIGIIHEMKT